MYIVSWTDQDGGLREQECLTAGDRDAAMSSLRTEGLDPAWDPVPGYDEEPGSISAMEAIEE